MAAIKKEEKFINVIDVFWDGWFNSFKTFQTFQNGVEQKSLEVFESQKEWMQTIQDQLTKIEDESKKLADEWKTNLQDIVKNTQINFGTQNITEWIDRLEELGIKAESLAFSPSKTTFDLLSKSHSQLESALRKAIDQQQKNRAEVVNAIGDYVDELKQTQNGVFKSFEIDNPVAAK